MPRSDAAKAAHRGDGGDPQNADLAGGLTSGTDTPAHRAAQALFCPPAITSSSTTPEPGRLPLVEESRARDIAARIAIGLPIIHYGLRRDFAASITLDAFGAAPRRGRRRR